MRTVLPCKRYNPADFQKFRLKDPDTLKYFNTYTNSLEYDKGALANALSEYCLSAGITISQDDILSYRLERKIGKGRNAHRGRAPIDVHHLQMMYKTLFFGRRSQEFLDMLHAFNWWSIHELGPVVPTATGPELRRAGQLDLFIKHSARRRA